MKKDILDFTQRCNICQRNKYATLSPAGLLSPLSIPTQVWSNISMDFIIGAPRPKERLLFLWWWIANDVAQTFTEEVVKLHGFPATIVTNRDQLFLSTKLKYSIAYHPKLTAKQKWSTDCLETYLRCFSGENLKQWPNWLSWVEYCFNTKYHSSVKMSHFQILYGRTPLKLFKGDTFPSKVEDVIQLQMERDNVLQQLKQNLDRAQQRISVMHIRKEGKYNLVQVQPYWLKSLARKRNEKLSSYYYGPYKIFQRIGSVAYKLELPEHACIYPIFHVCLLKKALATSSVAQPLPPSLTEEWELQSLLKDVLVIEGQYKTSFSGSVFLLVRIHGNNWQSFRTTFLH
ncbi:Tf2-8, partial [Mucuna pruriens]